MYVLFSHNHTNLANVNRWINDLDFFVVLTQLLLNLNSKTTKARGN